jgi:adenylate cyclase
MLVDESTNGTYLAMDGDREVLVRRARVPLRGRGKIGFGTSTAKAEQPVRFDCS